MTTWAGIVRVSHMGERKQGADDFHADRDQVEGIERGLPTGAKLDLLPAELDVSGGLSLEKRPSLLAAVEGVESGRYAGIIVAYLSRLGRSTREQLRAWDRVEAAGGRIICVQENIDTATPTGRFMRTILLANAEREREEHAVKFDNLRHWATDAGIWQRRQTPTGYSKDPTTRRLVPNEDAPLIVKAFRDATSVPMRQIARDLRMTPTSVRRILQNRVYLGELRIGGRERDDGTTSPLYVNPTAHPAIVTEDEFAAAQFQTSRPSRSGRPVGLLTGVVRCAGCGYRMTRYRKTSYGCHRVYSGGRCPNPTSVSIATLEPYVEMALLSELSKLTAQAAKGHNAKAAKRAFVEAEQELTAFVANTSARIPGYADGLACRQADFDQAREALNSTSVSAVIPTTTWDDLDANERNRLARALLGAVVVSTAKRPNVSVQERVQIWREFDSPAPRAERSHGIRPIVLLDSNDPNVIRVPLAEDGFENSRAA